MDLVKHFKLLGVYMSDDLSWNKLNMLVILLRKVSNGYIY